MMSYTAPKNSTPKRCSSCLKISRLIKLAAGAASPQDKMEDNAATSRRFGPAADLIRPITFKHLDQILTALAAKSLISFLHKKLTVSTSLKSETHCVSHSMETKSPTMSKAARSFCCYLMVVKHKPYVTAINLQETCRLAYAAEKRECFLRGSEQSLKRRASLGAWRHIPVESLN